MSSILRALLSVFFLLAIGGCSALGLSPVGEEAARHHGEQHLKTLQRAH